jgi:hypothetical protein
MTILSVCGVAWWVVVARARPAPNTPAEMVAATASEISEIFIVAPSVVRGMRASSSAALLAESGQTA